MRSRTALRPDPPDGERDGLSPGLSLPECAEAVEPGGERLLDLTGFEVFLCKAAIRSDKLAPALGRGWLLSLALFNEDQRDNR